MDFKKGDWVLRNDHPTSHNTKSFALFTWKPGSFGRITGNNLNVDYDFSIRLYCSCMELEYYGNCSPTTYIATWDTREFRLISNPEELKKLKQAHKFPPSSALI